MTKEFNEYKKKGIVILKSFFNKNEINKTKQKLDELKKKQKKNRGNTEPLNERAIIGSLEKEKYFIELINKKKINKLISEILNSDKYIVWNAKCNIKKEYFGTVEYFHQDYSYWKNLGFKNNQKLFSLMICVDPQSIFNSSLAYYEKTHNKTFKHKKFLNINLLQKNAVSEFELKKLDKNNKIKYLNCKSGDVVLFDWKLIHGSSHNISSNSRKIILYQISSKKNYDEEKMKRFSKKFSLRRKMFEKRETLKFINANKN